MGRYTTVQIYSDSNPSMRSITYDQAVGSASAVGVGTDSNNINKTQSSQKVQETERSGGSVRAEKVDNPSGSTSGAGSGEFHIYRAARARETKRLQQLDEEEVERRGQAIFEEKVLQNMTSEERKTEKRRRKRLREKEAKARKKNMKLNGILPTTKYEEETVKNDLDDEFQYSPLKKNKHEVVANTCTVQKVENHDAKYELKVSPTKIKNDGSFLEMMKKKLAETNTTTSGTSA